MTTPIDDLIANAERILPKVRSVLDGAKADEAFEAWFKKLVASTPTVGAPEIKLTALNFKKAMRQAFRAGAVAACKK